MANICRRLRNILFQMTMPLFMWVPSLIIRRLYLRFFLKKMGHHNYFGRNIDIRAPYNIVIGNNNAINKHVVLDGRGGLTLGNNIDIAQDTLIWSEQHDYNDDYHKPIDKQVVIEDYVWMASRTSVLPGITIGKGAVVASGAVVTKDVASMIVVGGVPAKKIGERHSKLLYEHNFHPLFRI